MTAIEYRQAELDSFHEEIFGRQEKSVPQYSPPSEPLNVPDEQLIEKAKSAHNGEKFIRLWNGNHSDYPSQSEADLALCCLLAFWTRKDPGRMNRLFQQSGLHRAKWDREDYSRDTIELAIEKTTEIYESSRAEEITLRPERKATATKREDDRPLAPPTFSAEELLKAAESGQDGDASLFIKLHWSSFRFDHSTGTWFEWRQHFWSEDLVGEALAAIDAVVTLYEKEAQRLHRASLDAAKRGDKTGSDTAEAQRKVFLKKISALQRVSWKQGVLQLAGAGRSSLGITGREWDSKPWLLPFKNGVVNLRDGSFRPGRQEDYLKTVCPHDWVALNEPCPLWDRVNQGAYEDPGLIGFVQRVEGSSLVGEVVEHSLPIYHGDGRNAKSTRMEAIKHSLGPLAGPIPAEVLLQQTQTKNPDSPSSSLMALRGKRLVWASETERGRRFNTQKAKWLCGGDSLCGRENYGRRQVEFTPTHSLFLLTNDKPHAPASDYAFWQRVLLIPHRFAFVDDPQGPLERKRDPRLLEKLKAEASGILAWLVRGCLEWQRMGLSPPEIVTSTTKQYRNDEDGIGLFVEETCVTGTGYEVKAGTLFQRYQKWCEGLGEKPLSGRGFGEEIGKKFDSYRQRNGVHYIGLGLVDEG